MQRSDTVEALGRPDIVALRAPDGSCADVRQQWSCSLRALYPRELTYCSGRWSSIPMGCSMPMMWSGARRMPNMPSCVARRGGRSSKDPLETSRHDICWERMEDAFSSTSLGSQWPESLTELTVR